MTEQQNKWRIKFFSIKSKKKDFFWIVIKKILWKDRKEKPS